MAKDLFSKQADAYKKHRPVYPQALYDYILSFVKERENALDVATGNGQAAAVLANHFKKVYAIDSSAAQLQQAEQKENIEYLQRSAEHTFLNPHTFDLITVAQAYHWLQYEAFATEVKRIAKPAAVLAIWVYDRFTTDNVALNQLMDTFYFEIVGLYWDAARKHVDNHYNDLQFPFDPLPTHPFSIEAVWRRQDLLGYLSSWSSVQNYTKANGTSPLPLVEEELYSIMPDAPILIYFPIYLHLGCVR
jgi:ubiquinone/menaquinone biosynthesis C-methylase UbiE